MMREPKFKVKKNHSSRSFHTDVEIGRSLAEHFTSSSPDKGLTQLCDKLGNAIGNMAYTLLHTAQVQEIFIKPYEVDIFIEEGSRWNEAIDLIVKEAFYKAFLEKEVPSDNQVLIERYSSDRTRTYHSKIEISRSYLQDFYRPLRLKSQKYLDDVGFPGKRIVEKLFSIPGVVRVVISAYQVTVEIAEVFEWKEIEPQIKDVFKDVFGQGLPFSNK